MTNDELLGLVDDLDDPEHVDLSDRQATILDRCKQTLEAQRNLTAYDEAALKGIWDDKFG